MERVNNMNQALKINQLPMRTYRWLKMNAETMEMQEASSFLPIVSNPPESVTDGVRVERGADRAKILALFKDATKEIKTGDLEAIKPNGDTFVESKQAVPTGMGLRIDALMEQADIRADIYTVAANTRISQPVQIRFSPENGSACLARQVIHVKRGAEVTFLMDAYSHRSYAGFLGIQTYVLAEEGATVHFVRVQMLGGGFTHFDDIGAVVQKNAIFDLVRLEFGTDASFSGCAVNLLGDNASFACEVGYLARRKQAYDYNYIATHRGKLTKCTMHFHGVLLDSAKKLLRGTIDFRAGASGADGEENEDALLLSERAVNRTIPIILCQEEDISGHHGATIGQLSDDMLFYMQSRGFSEEEAKKLMIRARIMRVANLIPEGDLKSHVNAYLCDTL